MRHVIELEWFEPDAPTFEGHGLDLRRDVHRTDGSGSASAATARRRGSTNAAISRP
jgi:hypothetical protein